MVLFNVTATIIPNKQKLEAIIEAIANSQLCGSWGFGKNSKTPNKPFQR
jgi:hypothetical protein